MGRPKGSKNKAKSLDMVPAPMGSRVLVMSDSIEIKPKRTRKAKAAPTALEKLQAAGLTIDELKALLGQASDSKPTDKAALKAKMPAPMSAKEIAEIRKQSAIEQAKVRDPQLVVNDAVEQVVKPNWANAVGDAAGLKHFYVNAHRGGYTVSMDKEKWDAALKLHGIRGVLTACKPENGQDLEAQTVGRWRVMIG